MATEDAALEGGRVLRPNLTNKFRSVTGKKILEDAAIEFLTDQKYADASITGLSKNLAETIRARLIELKLPKYKFMVEVIIGEQRGQGARIHTACMWDVDTDSQVSHFYQNDSLFCCMIVLAMFTY